MTDQAPIVDIAGLHKSYASGTTALEGIDLTILAGEILALLGPNGAGKTTLISCVCGLSVPTAGAIRVAGHDALHDYRAARAVIGLVPQEIALEPFAVVRHTVAYSRGLFGLPRDPGAIEALLRQLSLWDKRDALCKELSGGMKRRVLIAKALAHEPRVLLLDEPTAGVDVELRRDMWRLIDGLREQGVTIILTTHYIEEAQAIADRIGVIANGRLLLVEDKAALMQRLGRKRLRLGLAAPLAALPEGLGEGIALSPSGQAVEYLFAPGDGPEVVPDVLARLAAAGLTVTDLETQTTSLEEIFVSVLEEAP